MLALVGGILLTAPAAGLLAPGVVALRQRKPAARRKVLLIGPRDRLAQHPVPSAHHEAVLALAGAGGATMR
ncbi:hypothetical protein [Saccharothrix texasensis]|uniref:Uncharacterized protein n=1 Tax=Saccharothrix texasensis TaxID=103734 RepID=A0A3N1HFM5_9PSEU|nr:hypothetical protein [Saccharothrix texasensis]ROP41309.1 hypothetical protein EDD40_6738 [Saccharothrix texasensis]